MIRHATFGNLISWWALVSDCGKMSLHRRSVSYWFNSLFLICLTFGHTGAHSCGGWRGAISPILTLSFSHFMVVTKIGLPIAFTKILVWPTNFIALKSNPTNRLTSLGLKGLNTKDDLSWHFSGHYWNARRYQYGNQYGAEERKSQACSWLLPKLLIFSPSHCPIQSSILQTKNRFLNPHWTRGSIHVN